MLLINLICWLKCRCNKITKYLLVLGDLRREKNYVNKLKNLRKVPKMAEMLDFGHQLQ